MGLFFGNLKRYLLVYHLAGDFMPDGKIQCPHCHALFNSDPELGSIVTIIILVEECSAHIVVIKKIP